MKLNVLSHVVLSNKRALDGTYHVVLLKSYSAMEIDHLLPKFVYEEHRFNYSNYVTSCSTCNQLKRQFDPLMEGESAMSMLEENRSKLIERVRDQLQKKYDLREREFETVKSIIVG